MQISLISGLIDSWILKIYLCFLSVAMCWLFEVLFMKIKYSHRYVVGRENRIH